MNKYQNFFFFISVSKFALLAVLRMDLGQKRIEVTSASITDLF